MKPTRYDLEVVASVDYDGYPLNRRRITPDEFDQIARAEGYLRLEGVDVEALRAIGLDEIEYPHDDPQASPLGVMMHLARQVLAALDEETS